jgi:hypothetical protein
VCLISGILRIREEQIGETGSQRKDAKPRKARKDLTKARSRHRRFRFVT